MLEDIALCEEVFHTASGVAFADLVIDGHRDAWPIRSKCFRSWLQRCYYWETGTAPSGSAIASALDLLEAASRVKHDFRRPLSRAGTTPAVLPEELRSFWQCCDKSCIEIMISEVLSSS
jgi:hypothetical protein